MKNFIRKYNGNILVIFSTIIFTLFFPFIVTSINKTKNATKIFTVEKMGKQVIFDNNGQSVSMDVEDFIPCVLYSMLPYDYEEEALKAQIVIIRTYIMLRMGENNSINVSELTLPYTSYNNLEKEWGNEYENNYNYTMKLISNTNKLVMKYEGNYIYPYYHEVSEGITCDGDNGYLQSVESKMDIEADNYLGISYFNKDDIVNTIKNNYGITISPDEIMTKIILTNNEKNNYVKAVTIGDKVVTGEEFRKVFNLPSGAYTMEEFSEGIKMVSKGIGNGKGLSLYAAKTMASQGKGYDEILKYFYSGITIE